MKTKKNARAKLENYSIIFLQLGLALSLFIVYLALNIKSFDRQLETLESFFNQEEVIEDIPMTKRVDPIKPLPPPPPAPEIIEVVNDAEVINEVILESTETDETESVKPIEINDIQEVIEDEEVANDIPFAVIEEPPIFPGCKGTKVQKKKCFSKSMANHIKNNFRTALGQELGLSPGIKKIFALFTINSSGEISNIKVRAPHKSLEKEAIRVIKLLPKMTPGKQRNRYVNVSYMQPIIFKIVE
ncbi:MAG: energy transducer TonB [Flavobacteriaceae bacterium]|nr:energy transducer TonB [Flavobacteriaceae bacterium]